MDFSQYKIKLEDDHVVLYLYLDGQMEEFAEDYHFSIQSKNFSEELSDDEDLSLKQDIQKFIKNKFPNVKITAVKLMIGSMMLGVISMSETPHHASAYSQTTAHAIYKVARGDSLYNIAHKFHVSVSQIKQLNHLTTNVIHVGQTLSLPLYSYTVGSGDTLFAIAKKYGTTVSDIQSMNGLTSTRLFIGEKLYIPISSGAAPTTSPTPSKAVTETTPSHQQVTTPSQPEKMYTVVSGDSLYLIAHKFGTSVSKITTLNNLSSTTIYKGQRLKIPGTQSQTTPTTNQSQAIQTTSGTKPSTQTYTVVAGDTLYMIAKKFNVTVDQLKTANHLTSDMIYIGQTLTIPVPVDNIKSATSTTSTAANTTAPTTVDYTIVSGDTLNGIAKKYQSTVADIKAKNHLSSDLILIGQTLIIPLPKPVDQSTSSTTTVPSTAQQTQVADTTPPKIPTIQAPPFINKTNVENDMIKGVTEANAKVLITISDGTTSIPLTTTADSSGAYQVTFNGSQLKSGQVTISAIAMDQAGNQSQASQTTVIKDTEAPAIPVLKIKSYINKDNMSQFPIEGQSEANSNVTITATDGSKTQTLQTKAAADGHFSTTLDASDFKDGAVKINASSTDQATNQSKIASASVIKDIVSNAPVVTQSNPINMANASAYTISGNAEPNAQVTLAVSDGVNAPITTNTTADLDGHFSVAFDVSSLKDEVLTVDAKQTDPAGNTSLDSTTLVKKDTVAAKKPTVQALSTLSSINESSYTIKGTGEALSTIFATFTDQSGQKIKSQGKIDSNGNFSLTSDLTSLTGDQVTVDLYQTDSVGNQSETLSNTIPIDEKGPTSITLQPLEDVVSTANQSHFSMTGTTEANATVHLTLIDRQNKTFSRSVKADKTGAFTFDLNLSQLADGPISVKATTEDFLDNPGKDIAETIQKDTVAPTGLTVDAANNNNVNESNASSYHIFGQSDEDGAIAHIQVSDGVNTIEDTALVSDGSYDLPVDLSSLKDGPLTVTVYQTDAAGNQSPSQTLSINKDTTVDEPVISLSQVKRTQAGYQYLINGKAEPNATIIIHASGQTGTEQVDKTIQADGQGTFNGNIDVSSFIDNGVFITVQQIDPSGNQSKKYVADVTSYVVGSGDTLWQISNHFGTTISDLMNLNNLTSFDIRVGQKINLPAVAGISMSVIPEHQAFNMGYLYFGNTSTFINTVQQTNGAINVVSPDYFNINKDGSLDLTSVTNRHFIATMQSNGIRVVPFITNNWNRALGEKALDNREQLAQQIADAVETYNLDGVNVDIENVTDQYRSEYTDFLRLLKEKLPAGKEISTAVAANSEGVNVGWQGSYDYAKLAQYNDYLMIMAYDQSYVGSKPGPIASIDWVEKSIQYAINQGVPKDKIVIGLAHYGRYWKQGAAVGGYGISNKQIKEAIDTYNGTVTYDETAQAPKAVFTIKEGDPTMDVYGTTLGPGTYTVWFENAQSLKAKVDLVKKYGIKGTGNWGLAQENSQLWGPFSSWISPTMPTNGDGTNVTSPQ